jgi:hypothetical protein
MSENIVNAKIKSGLIGVVALVFIAMIFWLGIGVGVKYGSSQLAIELNSTQAMLAFNRILDERKLNLLLSKGCVTEALAKTDIAIDQDTKLIASLFKEKLSPWCPVRVSAKRSRAWNAAVFQVNACQTSLNTNLRQEI